MIRRILIIVVLQLTFIYSQDFSNYKSLIFKGNIEEVLKSLPHIKAQYPNHPFVNYLEVTKNKNGEEALALYNAIIEKYPNTDAAELSTIKIGEYLYSIGLYTQAGEQLKMIPLNYPNSKYIENSVSLMKKSLSAIGDTDSLNIYLKRFMDMYPSLNFENYDYYASIVDHEKNEPIVSNRLNHNPWVVQVGAFGEKKNAKVLANRIISPGYEVEIIEKSYGISLYLVQIINYSTSDEARLVGNEVRNKFGLDYRIIKR